MSLGFYCLGDRVKDLSFEGLKVYIGIGLTFGI